VIKAAYNQIKYSAEPVDPNIKDCINTIPSPQFNIQL